MSSSDYVMSDDGKGHTRTIGILAESRASIFDWRLTQQALQAADCRIVFFTEFPQNSYRRRWSQMPARLAWRVLSWAEDKAAKAEHPSFRPDGSIPLACSFESYFKEFPAAEIARITAEHVDLLIRLGGRGIYRGAILDAATHGMVSIHHGDNRLYRGGPPGFWEIMNGEAHCGYIVQRLTRVLDGGQVQAWADALAFDGPLAPTTVGPQDLSVLPYTSGTTGLPKGCMHTHASIMHNAVACTLWGNGSSETVGLVVVPMFHITGMVAVMHAAVYAGATMVLMPRWDRELAGRLISRWKVTAWGNIPTMVIDLLASPNFASFDLSSLKAISGGGAAMPQAVAQRLFEVYGLRYAEGYGLTETAAPSHQNPLEHPKQQCLGIPFMSTDARVVDPDTLQEVPQGETGEIVVCGPEVFRGYWKHPEATAAAFFELDGQRFFRTGDLGRVDEDGYFFITDRLKRMINASGFKVWPAEVEALMFKHPAIQEACVIGTQDAYRGESVKAVVVLRATHQGQVSEQDIIDWCREHMAAYKVPRAVQFVDALPKSGSGKVMWRLLQEKEKG